MLNLARSPLAPVLGQRVPLRGPARLLHRSYARAGGGPGSSPRRLTSKFGDTFDVDLASFLEWQIWAFGSFEDHFAELFRYMIRPGDLCIDVGANIGVHTVRLAKLTGKQGKVIAIEADQELARRASHNVRLNHLENVCVIHAAAAERAGDSVLLYRPGGQDPNRARASMLPLAYLTGAAARVETVAVDSVADQPVALIKIDVEGCEWAVVSGATETIASCSPAIIFEYAPDILHDSSRSPFELLQERGYELFKISKERHRLTGRGGPVLQRLRRLPAVGGDILAAAAPVTSRLNSLVR